MMRIYSGTVKAPASKSSSLRALICCALSENDNSLVIHNISRCDDVLAGIELVRELRLFTTILDNDSLTFTSNIDKLRERDSLICNVGESGFLARAFVSIANYFTSKVTLIGKGTLLKRDLGIAEFADKIGLSACNSKLPTTIQGKIKPGKFVVTEKRSSQFLSGLLFVLPLLTEDSMVTIEELVSRPYIDLTLSYLARCGIKYEWVSKNKIAIPGKQS